MTQPTTTQVLVSDDGNVKVYNLVDASGNVVGTLTEQYLNTTEVNRLTLRKRAKDAMVDNTAFLALSNPTNAQVLAQVKSLTRQNNALIRLVIEQLDGTE